MLVFAGLMAAEPVKLGAPAPEFRIPDLRGEPVTLAEFRDKRELVLLFADLPDASALAARLEKLETALLLARERERALRRRYLGDAAGPRAVLICRRGRVRLIRPVARAADVLAMVEIWRRGRLNYTLMCERCHGDEGGSEWYEAAPSLIGIGSRLKEDQVRPKVFAAQIGPDHFVARGFSISRRDVDSLVIYVMGL
jgi:hypothetical protein